MSTEELMKPRWKVIADFPGNQGTFNIGEIIVGQDHWSGDGTFYTSPHPFDAFCPDEYPAIFKKLEWWEERKVEDIPDYLKLISRNEIVKVVKKVGGFSGTVFTGKMFQERETWTHLFFYLPSTKEEYESYQKSISSGDEGTIEN